MDLADEICIQHPRAVMKQNCSVSIQEDGTTIINQNETRMECLFRHIRNSFAHNHTYLFDNDNILFSFILISFLILFLLRNDIIVQYKHNYVKQLYFLKC